MLKIQKNTSQLVTDSGVSFGCFREENIRDKWHSKHGGGGYWKYVRPAEHPLRLRVSQDFVRGVLHCLVRHHRLWYVL